MSVSAASPFRYSHTIGLMIQQGRGFHNPMDLAIGKDDVWYVVSRSNAMWAPNSLRVGMCTVDEEYLGEFGSFGTGEGQFVWPIGIAADSHGRIYISDEHRHDVQVFEADGTYVGKWGTFGSEPGKLNRPSSMAIDEHDRVFLVDGFNHRVQIFSTDGAYLDGWGSEGKGPGQFNIPWGIYLGPANDVYVADWQNDRVQRLTRDGRHLATFGSPGTGPGELKRPAGVGVDSDGTVFVADWGNERVQVFRSDGSLLTTLIGDATMSKWGQELLDARADLREGRALVEDMEPEKRFVGPTAVKIDAEGNILVVDSCRYRVQIYRWADR
jgi:tripartite motif-containing protein 71